MEINRSHKNHIKAYLPVRWNNLWRVNRVCHFTAWPWTRHGPGWEREARRGNMHPKLHTIPYIVHYIKEWAEWGRDGLECERERECESILRAHYVTPLGSVLQVDWQSHRVLSHHPFMICAPLQVSHLNAYCSQSSFTKLIYNTHGQAQSSNRACYGRLLQTYM